MLKMGGGSALYLFILTVFFTFSYVGCVQEEIGPQASLDEDVVLAKKGDVDDFYKDGTSSDCHCELSITNVSGYDGKTWLLHQIGNVYPSFSQFGNGNNWHIGGNEYAPLPSPFQALGTGPSDCYHLEVLLIGGPISNDVTFSTEVRCYEGNSTTPATITYHQLVVPANNEDAQFYRRFLCRYLTNSESTDCSRTGGGSQ